MEWPIGPSADHVVPGSADRWGVGNSFVGRECELRLLDAALRDAAQGVGRLVLLTGEAGIGKTRLASEYSRVARERNIEVLWGRCWEGEGAPAFWPWVQIVRAYASRRDRDTLAEVMGAHAAEIVRLIPSLGRYFPGMIPGADPLEPAQGRFRQFDSLTSFLRTAAQGRALLIVLDDIHWADLPSLLLLHFLSRELAGTSLLVLATYRTKEPGDEGEFTRRIAELVREPSTTVLSLKGLANDDVLRFLMQAAGSEPSASLVQAVFESTEGNPLFVTEIVRLLLQDGAQCGSWDRRLHRLSIPETLRGAIDRRLEGVSTDARGLLAMASVVGREFSINTLALATGTDESAVCRLVDEAAKAGVVQRLSTGDYRFTHVLLRDVLYEGIRRTQCADMHRAIGEALEANRNLEANEQVALLSYHFTKALPAGDAARALGYATDAARSATALLAYEEAAEHYRRGLEAFAFTDGSLQAYCELLLELGHVQNSIPDAQGARITFRRVLGISRKMVSPELFGRAALGFGGVFAVTGLPDTELIAVLEEAIERHGHGISSSHSMLLAGLSIQLYFDGDISRRGELARQALAMARAVGDATAELMALDASHYVSLDPSGLESRLAVAREMVSVAKRSGSAEMRVRGHLRLCADLLEAGDVVAADRELSVASWLAQQLGHPVYLWQVVLKQSTRATMSGRWTEAIELIRRGLVIADRAGDIRAIHSFLAQRWWLSAQQDAVEDSDVPASLWRPGFEAHRPPIPTLEAASALQLCQSGKVSEAQQLFDQVINVVRAESRRDAFTLCTLCLLAETCALLKDRRAADELYRMLAEHRTRYVTLGLAAVFLGSTAHFLALLAITTGDFEDAVAQFEYALTANQRVGARPLTARTRFEYGKVLAQLGREDEGRAQIGEAITEFEALGMGGCLERARTALDELKGSAAAGRRVDGDGFPADAAQEAVFRSDGDYWTVSFAGKTARIKSMRGLHYIAYLLARANQPVYALDLAVLGVQPSETGMDAAVARQQSMQVATFGGRGVILDERARAEYRSRLRELAAEREQIERLNDYGHLARIDEEIAAIESYLVAGSGPKGRSRRWTSPAERARVNVRNSIAKALRTIARHHEALHRHLQNSIKTGAVCYYAPEQGVGWQIFAG